MGLRVDARILRIALGLAAVACGGQDPATANQTSSIAGDWMICQDETCSRLDNQGWRFGQDAMAQSLDGSDGPASEPVCVALGDERLPYRFENGTLTFREHTLRAEIDRNVLTLYDVPYMDSDGTSGTETVRMLKVQTTVSDSCPTDPPPAP